MLLSLSVPSLGINLGYERHYVTPKGWDCLDPRNIPWKGKYKEPQIVYWSYGSEIDQLTWDDEEPFLGKLDGGSPNPTMWGGLNHPWFSVPADWTKMGLSQNCVNQIITYWCLAGNFREWSQSSLVYESSQSSLVYESSQQPPFPSIPYV